MRIARALLVLAPLATLAGCTDGTAPPASPDAAAMAPARRAADLAAVDLGTLGGATSTAWDVNDRGVVVGGSQVGGEGGETHAFRWTVATGMRDLGTLGGDYSVASAVNRHGVAAGTSTNASGETRVVTWSESGVIRDLGTIPGSTFIGASAINDRGEIVGTYCTDADPCRGFRWTEGTGLQPVPVAEGEEVYFADVNRRGDVAGRFCCGRATYYGMFLLEASGAFHDIGGVTDANAGANALNAHGVVVGSDQPEDVGSPYLLAPVVWSSGQGLRVLGSLGGDYGFANDVNDRGEIVGGSTTVPGDCCATNAFSWTERGGMADLGPGRAHAISERGTIVGVRDGRAVLWSSDRAFATAARPVRAAPATGKAAAAAASDRCGGDPAIVASETALQRCLWETARRRR